VNSLEAALQRFGLQPGQLEGALSEQVQHLLGVLVARTVGLFTGLGGWLLQAGVALFTLYYLLRDGESLVARLRWLLPLAPQLNERLFRQAYEVTHATIYGNVMVAFVQGLLGGTIFWILGIPSPAVWGTLMGLLSLLPVVGAFLVWIPAAVMLLLSGHIMRGVILLAFGTFIISTIDNVLRALLVGGRAQMHPLIVFFSVLGGLLLFGAVGLLLGPVLFVVSLTLIEVARRSLDGTATLDGGTVPDSAERVDSVWA
jgi:predicted PurR-regulated permease PerM